MPTIGEPLHGSVFHETKSGFDTLPRLAIRDSTETSYTPSPDVLVTRGIHSGACTVRQYPSLRANSSHSIREFACNEKVLRTCTALSFLPPGSLLRNVHCRIAIDIRSGWICESW